MSIEIAEFQGYPESIEWQVSKNALLTWRYGYFLLPRGEKLKVAWDDMRDCDSIWKLEGCIF